MSKHLICDLDNTLYDWIGYFVPSFYKMVDEAVLILNCSREELLDELKAIHQSHHDVEHPYALLETQIVHSKFEGMSKRQMLGELKSAFLAFEIEKKRTLKLYDGVRQSLELLHANNVEIVAHTEGKLFAVLNRMKYLNILKYFKSIYCRERSLLLADGRHKSNTWLRQFPMEKVTELSQNQRKPSATVLKEICFRETFDLKDSVYVGDSIARDISMANDAGVKSVWAKYGTKYSTIEYNALVRVSHWSKKEVIREKKLQQQAKGVFPTLVIENSFEEILPVFGWNLK